MAEAIRWRGVDHRDPAIERRVNRPYGWVVVGPAPLDATHRPCSEPDAARGDRHVAQLRGFDVRRHVLGSMPVPSHQWCISASTKFTGDTGRCPVSTRTTSVAAISRTV